MPTWACLIRGINLGPHNRVSMPDLRDALQRRGHADVRTHLQSGNVIVRTRHRSERGVANHLAEVLATDLDVMVPVVARSADDMAEVVKAMPFPSPDPKLTHVVFLTDEPDDDSAERLRAIEASPDRVVLVGREVFVEYAVSSHTSRLTLDRISRALGVEATARNWRTVTAIADMVASDSDPPGHP